ncbi:MAG: hypothetical protein J0L99_06835 [Chitinophagales bacterium]|nr:hypothetical protein [Chitinophagales bacterium]
MFNDENKEMSAFNDPADIRYYLHHPHDKYVRALLQHRIAALEIIQS